MENLQNIFVQVMRKPKRKVILKRGICAEDYFAYCGEVSCDVWGMLMSMDSLCGEPVCLWLPEAEYLVAQGEPFKEGDYAQAVLSVQYSLDHYDPAMIGYEWDHSNPRIQLEPRGERGYIELKSIKRISVNE